MNKIEELKNEIKLKDEAAMDSEAFEAVELTDEDLQRIEELKDEKKVVMVQTDSSGASVEIPIDSYLESLDKNVTTLKNSNIKLLTQKINKTKDDLLEGSREEIKTYILDKTLTNEEIDACVDSAIEAVKKHFNLQYVDSNVITKLNRMKAVEVISIIPDGFIDLFSDKSYRTSNPMKVKDDILVSLGYCIAIGPEIDKLNADIDYNNRMIDIMMRLNDVNIDFAEIIRSEESIKDLASRILKESNDLSGKYRKYVITPDAINNLYSQKKYTLEKLNVEYTKLRDELVRDDERAEVSKEIKNNEAMIDVYEHILSMNNFSVTVDSIVRSSKNGINMRDLNSKSFTSFDSFRKIKENVAIPGYIGNEPNIKVMYNNYVNYFKNLIPAYNKVIDAAESNGDYDLKKIDVDGEIFAKCIIIVLGKITKILTKKNDLHSSTELVCTFDMICRLGTELFMLDRLNDILRPMYSLVK